MATYRYRKSDLETELNKSALWAVTYGDLMSYLMIFFLVLFSFSVAKKGKGSTYEDSVVQIQRAFGGKVDSKALERIMARRKQEEVSGKLEQVVAERKLSEIADVQSTESKIKLVLRSPVLFDLASADLKPEATPILQAIVDTLKGMNNDIVVEGHTDNVPVSRGRYASNWELSMARAYSVIRFFEENGIDPKRLAGAGYGDNRPLSPNDTPEGRAKNRRIEISLIKR
jgi:chemotaxis protein MotB